MARDTQAIKERIDLAAVVESDLGPPEKRSNERFFWRCPFHDETEASFVVFPDGGFKCFGCGKGGDLYSYIMLRDNVGFPEAKRTAIALAGGDLPTSDAPTTARRRRPAVRVADPPAQGWQDAAGAVMLDCAEALFSDAGSRARAWLHERGLKDETLAEWYIGFNDADQMRHGLYVRRGITIPHYQRARGDVWALKIRRAADEQKYVNVRGSRPHLWGIDNLAGREVAIVCEGEFDGLLLWQEAGDLAAVVAQGAATNHDIDTWLPYLLHLRRLYIATDNDDAGQRAVEYWQKRTRRARRARPPLEQKDLTDGWQAGADLRGWVLRCLLTDWTRAGRGDETGRFCVDQADRRRGCP